MALYVNMLCGFSRVYFAGEVISSLRVTVLSYFFGTMCMFDMMFFYILQVGDA